MFFKEELSPDQGLLHFMKKSKACFGASKTVPGKWIWKFPKIHFLKISEIFLIFMKDKEGDLTNRNFFGKIELTL